MQISLIAATYPDTYYVCAIGSAKIRKQVIDKITEIVLDIRYAMDIASGPDDGHSYVKSVFVGELPPLLL